MSSPAGAGAKTACEQLAAPKAKGDNHGTRLQLRLPLLEGFTAENAAERLLTTLAPPPAWVAALVGDERLACHLCS